MKNDAKFWGVSFLTFSLLGSTGSFFGMIYFLFVFWFLGQPWWCSGVTLALNSGITSGSAQVK